MARLVGDGAPRISVLVPLVDKVGDLREIQSQVFEQLAKVGEGYEILYMLGTSDPAVAKQVMELRAEQPERVRVVRFASPAGDAALLAAGFEHARGELLFSVPPVFDVDLAILGELYTALEAGADLVIASRSNWREGAAERLQSRLFNRLVSWATGVGFLDIASRTRAVRREIVQEVPIYGEFHRYLPMLAQRLGFAVREIPATQHPRFRRAAIVHTPQIYLWRALDLLSILFVSRFTRHPLRLFGGVGSAFGALGIGVLAVITLQRLIWDEPLADRPMLILGTLLMGLGAQLFTIGLLGELILFFQARNIRDYRVTSVYETPGGGLPAPAPTDEPRS
jgi:hypothetical protein